MLVNLIDWDIPQTQLLSIDRISPLLRVTDNRNLVNILNGDIGMNTIDLYDIVAVTGNSLGGLDKMVAIMQAIFWRYFCHKLFSSLIKISTKFVAKGPVWH